MHPALRDILESPGPNRLDRSFPGTLRDLFARRAPLELEIGAGKGRFLLQRAMAVPEHDFVAIDWIWKYLKIGWQRACRRGLANLLCFKAEAREVVTHLVDDESLHIVHVYFPDPWHKRRHHKRRLLTEDFFRLVQRRLEPGGRLEIATDNFDYFVAFRAALVRAGESLWADVREQKNRRILDPQFETNFEMKYRAEGRELYYMELVK